MAAAADALILLSICFYSNNFLTLVRGMDCALQYNGR
jgi:hypothetical protein